MNPALSILIRDHYKTLQGYVSAGMEVEKSVDTVFMNANENPFELPGLKGVNRYPKPQPPELLNAYSKLYGVPPDNIVATRGADEALVVLTKIFCEPHKDAVLQCSPAFGMYAVDARAMPADVIDVPLIKDGGTFTLDVAGIIKAARDAQNNVKLIFICSPNNPTGNVFAADDIADICRKTAGHAVVILDETYIEFAQSDNKADSFAARLPEFPNLIILRTLSKSYSLAGMRMGSFLCADTNFMNLVRTKGLDAYPLPQESIAAALHVMSPPIRAQAQQNIKTLISERKRLEAAFAANPFVRHIYPSDANFFLLEMTRAKDFIDHCAAHKIILRDFTTKPMTTDCVRISVGLPQENDELIRLLGLF